MKKIMLVDDVEISNYLLRKLIGQLGERYSIHDFTSPEKALDNLAEINPDKIFLDINMPLINGWQFLEHMKEKGYNNDVVMVTSSTSKLDEERSKAYENVSCFLFKPVNLAMLSDILNDENGK